MAPLGDPNGYLRCPPSGPIPPCESEFVFRRAGQRDKLDGTPSWPAREHANACSPGDRRNRIKFDGRPDRRGIEGPSAVRSVEPLDSGRRPIRTDAGTWSPCLPCPGIVSLTTVGRRDEEPPPGPVNHVATVSKSGHLPDLSLAGLWDGSRLGLWGNPTKQERRGNQPLSLRAFARTSAGVSGSPHVVATASP